MGGGGKTHRDQTAAEEELNVSCEKLTSPSKKMSLSSLPLLRR